MSRFLLTGSSGFLGKVLLAELQKHYEVSTLGRHKTSYINCDITNSIPPLPKTFDYVVHNAGKAHMVPQTAAEQDAFFQVNYQGTLNLLKALDQTPPRCFIFISTIAVYGRESGNLIDENHPLEGNTPYALSKIQAEAAIQTWGQEHKVKTLILRLPLIAGPNPPGNLGAINQSIASGKHISIRGNQARKSMVLAEEVAQLIPNILDKTGIFNLTDGNHPTFNEIETAIAEGLNKRIRFSLPIGLLKIGAKLGDFLVKMGLPFPLTSLRLSKITQTLTFDDTKARIELGWTPKPVLEYLKKGKLNQ